jgi:hypothetical protein
MIELANKQYATILDCVAGEDLVVGQAITLVDDSEGGLEAVPLADADGALVWGILLANWINPRSTTVVYSGSGSGLDFDATDSGDSDAHISIPAGARMYAVGGPGVTQVRLFESALDAEFAGALPVPGDVLGVNTDGMLCSTGNGDVVAGLEAVARVVAADSVSATVILGLSAS